MKKIIWKHPIYDIHLEYYTNLDTLFLTVGKTGYDLSKKEVDDLIKALTEIKGEK